MVVVGNAVSGPKYLSPERLRKVGGTISGEGCGDVNDGGDVGRMGDVRENGDSVLGVGPGGELQVLVEGNAGQFFSYKMGWSDY